MRLPDKVDDVVVVERVDHVLEQARPLLGRFAFGKPGDGLEDELVCPVVVAREHARGLRGDHGLPRLDLPWGIMTPGAPRPRRPPPASAGGERPFFSCKMNGLCQEPAPLHQVYTAWRP